MDLKAQKDREELEREARQKLEAIVRNATIPDGLRDPIPTNDLLDTAQALTASVVAIATYDACDTIVREAKATLDRGSTFICMKCGQPLPDNRLIAAPWAARCIPCEERMNQETEEELAAA